MHRFIMKKLSLITLQGLKSNYKHLKQYKIMHKSEKNLS